ncbi:MAG: hypothetical protein RR706_09025 [Muribaculaceae bacterium]
MVVSKSIFIYLYRNCRKAITRHIEETIVPFFAEENRQNFISSKDRLTVRVFRSIANAMYLIGVGCCLLAAWVFGDTSLAK